MREDPVVQREYMGEDGAASKFVFLLLLSILHTAIFANSHSVVASNGRKRAPHCIHQISRAFAI